MKKKLVSLHQFTHRQTDRQTEETQTDTIQILVDRFYQQSSLIEAKVNTRITSMPKTNTKVNVVIICKPSWYKDLIKLHWGPKFKERVRKYFKKQITESMFMCIAHGTCFCSWISDICLPGHIGTHFIIMFNLH